MAAKNRKTEAETGVAGGAFKTVWPPAYALTYLLTYVQLANPQSENTTRRLVFRKHRFVLLAAWETRAHSHPRARQYTRVSPLLASFPSREEQEKKKRISRLLRSFCSRKNFSNFRKKMMKPDERWRIENWSMDLVEYRLKLNAVRGGGERLIQHLRRDIGN